ncbi:hypothetical protein K2X40_00850 [Candidatus Babeliales bacterium]|nr:hypothetical protein [Candidatus Babeliales bacterium]
MITFKRISISMLAVVAALTINTHVQASDYDTAERKLQIVLVTMTNAILKYYKERPLTSEQTRGYVATTCLSPQGTNGAFGPINRFTEQFKDEKNPAYTVAKQLSRKLRQVIYTYNINSDYAGTVAAVPELMNLIKQLQTELAKL